MKLRKKNVLDSHKNEKHKEAIDKYSWEEPYRCKTCGKEFNSMKKCINHENEKQCKETSIVCCPLCSYKNSSEPEVASHVANHHPDVQMFKCDKCKHDFQSETELHVHIANMHVVCCPLCSYKSSSEPDVTSHVENHHQDVQMFKCNKCNHDCQSEAELNVHTTNVHVFKCNDYSYEADSRTGINSHTSENHGGSNTEDILLILDSHANTVKPRTIERKLKGKLFAPCYSRPKEGRAYCSTSNWPNAKYPESSMETKVKELLKVRPYRGAVMMAPCNDISNIKDLEWELTVPPVSRHLSCQSRESNLRARISGELQAGIRMRPANSVHLARKKGSPRCAVKLMFRKFIKNVSNMMQKTSSRKLYPLKITIRPFWIFRTPSLRLFLTSFSVSSYFDTC